MAKNFSWKKITSIVMILCMLTSMWSLPVKASEAPRATERLSEPMVGIDVSSWNEEIDWAKVKAAGVEFAIVRVFHHIKNTPNYELDEQFERNVREAQKYGIELGAYFFSYAQTLDAITAEANMVVKELNKYPGVFSFPIVFDAEDGDTIDDPDVSGNDIYDIGDFAGDACQEFCDILTANGYYPMVYSYAWYYEANIGMSKVKDYDLWLASYPKSNGTQIYAGTGPADAGSIDHSKRETLSSYDDNVTMWQYTGAGKIDGIYAGDGGAIVDLNVCYVDYPSIIKSGGWNGYTTTYPTEPLVYRTGANGPASTYKSSKYYTHVTSIGLTGDGVTDTLAAALSQLGYYEGTASNPYSGLYNTWDEYTTNKTTEYVYNYGDADSSGYKMAWCASFCSWAIYQSQTADHATHDESCRENIGDETYIWRECSCYQWADQLKRFDLYSERGSYTPKAGDLIFFKMDGGGSAWTNHIGLVRYCDGDTVYTVEGNRHNHVGLYSYSLSDSQICGYGILPYPTNDSAPKVDYSGENKTAGQYITNNVTLSVSSTKGGSTSFTIGKYVMFDVTGFDGSYAKISYNGSTGYATLNSDTIQVTATQMAGVQSRGVKVHTSSIKNSSFAAGSGLPSENYNDHNPNIFLTGLTEDSNRYKGLENYGTNKEKIMINGRTWDKWESREGAQVLNNIWVYGIGDGEAYLGIDIADTSRLRVQGTNYHGEEIETIVIKRGFEIVQTSSNLWSEDEISADGSDVACVAGVFKENVILIANSSGGFNVVLGGSDSLGLEGYSFETKKTQNVELINDSQIRSGPGTSYTSVGIAYEGDTFEYLDEIKDSKWLHINYYGQAAWISNYNASVVDVPQYVVLTADANVRSGPGTENSVLGVGLEGDSFEYLNEIQNDKWQKVNYNGETGWISNVNTSLTEVDEVVLVSAENLDWDESVIIHNYEWSDVTPATCTEGGIQKGVCTVCQLEETRSTDALGHDWGEWVETKAPTATKTGEETRTCKNDASHIETQEIPALGLPVATTGVLKVDVIGGSSFTIAVNGGAARPQGASYINTKMPIGTQVVLEAKTNDSVKFLGWMNESGAIESTTTTFSFHTTGNDYYKATYQTKVEGVNVVIFKNTKAVDGNGQILEMQYYAAGDEIIFPDTPIQAGYNFVAWNMTEEEIQAKLAAGEDVIVEATWELAKTYIDVVVIGGTVSTPAQDNGQYLAFNALTVVADAATDGQKFAYWTDAKGNIVSYDTTFKCYPIENVEFTAVYVAEDTVIEYTPIVNLSASPTIEGEKITYLLSWDIDDSIGTVTGVGIIIVDKDNYNEDTFVHGTTDSNVVDYAFSNKVAQSGEYAPTKSGSLYEHTYVAAMWVQIQVEGQEEPLTVYSPIIEVYKPAL